MATKFTCCECGAKADPNIEVDGTGRCACSKACENKLLGRDMPQGKTRGWYCNGHGAKRG